MTGMNDADFVNWSPGEAMLADRSGLLFVWLEIDDDGESFVTLRALLQADKQALFFACIAHCEAPARLRTLGTPRAGSQRGPARHRFRKACAPNGGHAVVAHR